LCFERLTLIINDMDHTVEEAAEKLKLSPATIRRLIAGRELSAFRSGKRKWLVPEESIAEYRTRQMVVAEPKVDLQRNGDQE
jgi:excisionase family DNA binding protein